MIEVRKEQPQDYDTVYQLVRSAFSSTEHSDGDEQNLVNRLRNSTSFIPDLSLVAVLDKTIVGYILFTKIKIGDTTQLALAPLAVLPEYQKQGVGAALIYAGHHIARTMNYDYSVVLGSEYYYPKFGYEPASKFDILPPFEVPNRNFMALPLQNNPIKVCGTVEYAKEFFEQ